MKLPQTAFSDSEGYVERECPSCFFTYRIRSSDWEKKTFEYEVFCPRCKESFPSCDWWTKTQVDIIEHLANNKRPFEDGEKLIISKGLKNRFEGLNRYENITYKKDRPYSVSNNPVGIKRSFENDIVCSSCGTSFKTVGGAFVCPCCSFDNVLRYYKEFLTKANEMVGCVNEMKDVIFTLDGEEEAERYEKETLYNIAEDVYCRFEAYCQGVFRIIGVEKYSNIELVSLNKTNKQFFAIFGREITDMCDNDSLVTSDAVFSVIRSFLSKKRKEKTPRITLQDVCITVDTIIKTTDRITAVAFFKSDLK